MAERPTIVDTGPLVAALVADDQYHEWAVAQLAELEAPLLTCESVLTETCFLLQKLKGGDERFFEMLDTGLLHGDFAVLPERQALARLVFKYRSLPMSLADACLVRMSELHRDARVLTIDRHFRIYRRNGRQQIPVIMPN